jgi:hypothetical protein
MPQNNNSRISANGTGGSVASAAAGRLLWWSTYAAITTLCGCNQPTSPGDAAPMTSAVHETTEDTRASGAPPAASDRSNVTSTTAAGSIHFTDMLSGSGITFRHTSGDSPEKAFPASNGSGVGILDYDRDGDEDLAFGNGTTFPAGQGDQSTSDAFYQNQGDWKFVDVTDLCGFGDTGYTAGLAAGDFDNDGFTDIYAAAVGKNRFLRNQGDGTFVDISVDTGTADDKWATGAAFVDIDEDGLLDLYVCNYAKWSLETNRFCGDQSRGIRMYCSPTLYPPENDVLYHSQGNDVFLNTGETLGINSPPGRAQGIACADFDADGRTDIYVTNDIQPNALLIRSEQVGLLNVGENSGVAYDHLGRAQASMGIAVGDVDRNGLPDLFVTNYEKEHNALYENKGGRQFLETGLLRIPEGSLPYVGWGTSLTDFDLDGWVDLIVTNGHTDNNLSDLGKEGEFLQPPGLWKNTAGTFSLILNDSGNYFRGRYCGRGLATGDLDNDGDIDVVIGHQDDSPALLRNDCSFERTASSIEIRLIGTNSNRDAIGSSIVVSGIQPPLLYTVLSGGSYQSTSPTGILIPQATNVAAVDVEVKWPSGVTMKVDQLNSGNAYAIIQSGSESQTTRVLPLPLRKKASLREIKE